MNALGTLQWLRFALLTTLRHRRRSTVTVAIARALVKRPRLVIADEPTASLDSHTADQVLALMRERCHAEGAAFVIATHDSRLTRACDRVLALLDGRLQ